MFQSDFFPDRETSGTVPLAFAIGKQISRRLADGCHLTRPDIAEFFASQTGVQDWGSAWSIDDYNNAVEIGTLLWLREFSRVDLDTGFHEAAARFDWLEAALPPRHVRSEGQVELQQFSTPPILAWLMAKAASLRSPDRILEPSAGNGALALWGDAQDCSMTLNEIDRARRNALAQALLQRLAAVRGRLSLCADQAAAAKWWLSMPMASVSAEGPMPKALSTRRTSPLMPGCRHQGRACPLRRARMTSNPLIVA